MKNPPRGIRFTRTLRDHVSLESGGDLKIMLIISSLACNSELAPDFLPVTAVVQ